MNRARIIGMWVITVIAIMATTFVTFIGAVSPLNLFVMPLLFLMWTATFGLVYSMVQFHRMYWK